MLKKIDLLISFLVASIAYLCILICVLVLTQIEASYYCRSPINGDLPGFIGLIFVYISMPVIFVIGKFSALVGVDLYDYPNSHPIISALVVFLLSLGVAFLIRRYRRS